MSQLYETAAERAKRLSQSTKTGNWGQDTWTDTISGGVSLGEDGTVKREGLAWWLQGLTDPANIKSIAEQKKGISDARSIDRAVENSGLTDSQISDQLNGGKLTASNVRGTIAEAQRTRLEKPTPVQQEQIDSGKRSDARAVTAQEDATAVARETLNVTREGNQNQLTLANNQLEMARLDNKFDRETASADRALTLKIANINADLQDKRLAYDRETNRLDKRDRMIAQLMSGIGQLGGAFSL